MYTSLEASRHRAAHDLVLLERLERLAEMPRNARHLAALVEDVVDVALLRRAWIELALDSARARP